MKRSPFTGPFFYAALVSMLGLAASLAAAIHFNDLPKANIMVEGDYNSLNGSADGENEIQYAWMKNGARYERGLIEGGLVNFYPVRPADAGLYQVRAFTAGSDKFKATRAPNVLSPIIPVGVIGAMPVNVPLAEGASYVLSIPITLPSGCRVSRCFWSRQYFSGDDPIADGASYSGTQTQTLTIKSVNSATEGHFRCHFQIRLPDGSLMAAESATCFVGVAKIPAFSRVPWETWDITIPTSRPTRLNVREWVDNQPTTFTATGLPPGLTINSQTGVISGTSTTPRMSSGEIIPYEVMVTIGNFKGSATALVYRLKVVPLAPGTIGTFSGLVDRDKKVNDNLGGTLRMVTTASGTFTGRLTLGNLAFPLRGTFDDTSFLLPRPAPLPPIQLYWAFGGANNDEPSARISIAGVSAFVGVALRRVGAGDVPANTEYAGYYTAGLSHAISSDDPPAPGGGYPEGQGFVGITVKASGAFTWTGRLADGTAFIGASNLTENGELQLHQQLAATHVIAGTQRKPSRKVVFDLGSIQGLAMIEPNTGEVDGLLDWVKAEQPPALASRNYALGIPLHQLTLTGGLYQKPYPGTLLLDCDETSPNAMVHLPDSLLSDEIIQPFTFTPLHTAVVPANANAIRLTSLNANTGLFGGSLTVTDNDPFDTSDRPAKIKRPGAFQGILVPRLSTGVGHLLMPALPDAEDKPVSAMPILSGSIEIRKSLR